MQYGRVFCIVLLSTCFLMERHLRSARACQHCPDFFVPKTNS